MSERHIGAVHLDYSESRKPNPMLSGYLGGLESRDITMIVDIVRHQQRDFEANVIALAVAITLLRAIPDE